MRTRSNVVDTDFGMQWITQALNDCTTCRGQGRVWAMLHRQRPLLSLAQMQDGSLSLRTVSVRVVSIDCPACDGTGQGRGN